MESYKSVSSSPVPILRNHRYRNTANRSLQLGFTTSPVHIVIDPTYRLSSHQTSTTHRWTAKNKTALHLWPLIETSPFSSEHSGNNLASSTRLVLWYHRISSYRFLCGAEKPSSSLLILISTYITFYHPPQDISNETLEPNNYIYNTFTNFKNVQLQIHRIHFPSILPRYSS
jgi:hypothetical protein